MKVFISSTYQDLVDHRLKASLAIERLGQQGIRMEVFGARPLQATEACLDEIDQCDAMVGIYAHRYGFVPDGSDRSITELEFDCAAEKGKLIFCYTIDENYPWLPKYIDLDSTSSRLFEFKNRISKKYVIENFTTSEDLAFKISSSLGRHLLSAQIRTALEAIPRKDEVTSPEGRTQVARRAERLSIITKGARLLLVNDMPHQMVGPLKILGQLGIEVEISKTTDDAMHKLTEMQLDIVVSDMARNGIQDDGIRLLTRMRAAGLRQPVIFTVGRFQPGRGVPGHAFGITNRVDDLLNLILDAIERVRG